MKTLGGLFKFPATMPVIEPAEAKRRAERDREFARREWENSRRTNLRRSDIPVELADERILVTKRGLITTSSVDAIEKWAHAPDKSFLALCGFVGRGKTMAAASYVAVHGGTYMRESELPRLIQFERERVLNTRVLVLDEWGRSKKVESAAAALFELVDERKRACRRTIMISNLSKVQLQKLYPDPGLWSRLNRACMFATAGGDDLREV